MEGVESQCGKKKKEKTEPGAVARLYITKARK